MKQQASQQKKRGLSDEKRPYEPPRANVVTVKPDERIMQCDFSSFRVCGPNR